MDRPWEAFDRARRVLRGRDDLVGWKSRADLPSVEGGDIESRPTHVTWEEWAMSGNDARYDADSAVLVAAKQKAALQEHAKMQWLACFDSALSAAEVGLERVGVDAD